MWGRSLCAVALAMALAAVPARAAPAKSANTGEQALRELYREMVETDTSVATGDCTALAGKIAARFRKAGFAENQITLFRDEAFPLDGGIVVTMPGSSATAKPMLLLGHLDVVNANSVHWGTDPYKLTQQGGYFYGRGTADMKALDAIWVDTLLRFAADGFKPKRTIKLALTCGEESEARINGVEWLVRRRPELLMAEFALNEGGGGETDGHGKVLTQSIAVGEKAMRNFDLEAFSAGGHSSIPIPDNAIYKIAAALQRLSTLRFPAHFNETTRRYFAKVGAARGDAVGAAMVRLAADPADAEADRIVSEDRTLNAMLRTTCVATLIQGGYVVNALPQTAKATINCRILPGEDTETTRDALVAAIGDPQMVITPVGRMRTQATTPSLAPNIMGPAEKLVARHYPGVAFVPAMMTMMTDATYLGALGIPTYGVPGLYTDPDGNNAHGHRERMAVQSLFTAREFLHDLVKVYAEQN